MKHIFTSPGVSLWSNEQETRFLLTHDLPYWGQDMKGWETLRDKLGLVCVRTRTVGGVVQKLWVSEDA